MSLDYWYLFPTAAAIATIATATGISGPIFFSTLFMFVVKLEPIVAFATALFTQLFGMGSGLVAYVRTGRVDYATAQASLVASVPCSIVGAWAAHQIRGKLLEGAFAIVLVFIGLRILLSKRGSRHVAVSTASASRKRTLISREGETYRYTAPTTAESRLFGGIGGALSGLISVGLAELQQYYLLARNRVPAPISVATGVFVVACTVFAIVLTHAAIFSIRTETLNVYQLASVVVFTVPGVIAGAQIGPIITGRVDPMALQRAIGLVFVLCSIVISILVLY